MRLGERLARVLRLGFYLGLGAGSLVVAACTGRGAPTPPKHPSSQPTVEARPLADAGPPPDPVSDEKKPLIPKPDNTNVICE